MNLPKHEKLPCGAKELLKKILADMRRPGACGEVGALLAAAARTVTENLSLEAVAKTLSHPGAGVSSEGLWEALMNRYPGHMAVVVGKGPSLNRWIEAGCPRPPHSSVVIGVNQVAAVVPDRVPYSVTADVQMQNYLHLPTRWIRGVPYLTQNGERVNLLSPCGGEWFEAMTLRQVENSRWIPGGAEYDRLGQSRSALLSSRRLFCALSSANPAVHLAWYLGCSSVMLVGIDGGAGRAACLADCPDRSGPPDYTAMRDSVEEECEQLFPGQWEHWKNR